MPRPAYFTNCIEIPADKKIPMLRFIVLLIVMANAVQCSTAQREIDLDKKIGQMIMIGFRGVEIDQNHPVVRDIRNFYIGGVVLFDYDVPLDKPVRNVQSPQQVRDLNRKLQAYSDTPLFIAIDQEGGKVARLKPEFGFPRSISAQKLGAINNPDTTRFYARRQAALLQKLNINVNFAPVVDLNTNPENPVIGRLDRSFSADPGRVVRHAGIFIDVYEKHGILPVIKHFPGHGSAWNDSHEGLADVTDTWTTSELRPYEELAAGRELPAVMTAHVFNARLDSLMPATLSKPVIQGILRDRYNFDGVVFSDDMQMKAIRSYYGLETAIFHAIMAGIDVLVFANNSIFDEDIAQKASTIIRKLVEDGKISPQRIDRSYRRIVKVKNSILAE